MLRRHFAIVNFMRISVDAITIMAIWNVSYFIRFYSGLFTFSTIPSFKAHLALTVPVTVILCLSRHWVGVYKSIRIQTIWAQIQKQLESIVLGYVLIISFLYYEETVPYTRILLFLFFFMLLGGLLLSHFILLFGLRYLRRKGYNQRHYGIIGTGKNAMKLFEDIQNSQYFGLRCAFFIDEDFRLEGKELHGVPVYGHIEKLPDIIKTTQVDEIYLARDISQNFYPILDKLQNLGVMVRILPDWGNLISISKLTTITIGSSILFTATDSPLTGKYILIKDIFDRAAALLLIVLFSIPMLLIAILLKITSKEPIFYTQKRIGMDQREFEIIKFRTMKNGSGASVSWTVKNDPRRTQLGAFLRSTSLDELPQLLNVLKGDMSLVGPRPEQPEFVEKFSEEHKKYMFRHRVKSGMTGWAQIHGFRGDSDIKKRLQYDIYYINHWSVWLDFWILILTPVYILKGKNAY